MFVKFKIQKMKKINKTIKYILKACKQFIKNPS